MYARSMPMVIQPKPCLGLMEVLPFRTSANQAVFRRGVRRWLDGCIVFAIDLRFRQRVRKSAYQFGRECLEILVWKMNSYH